MRVRRGIALAAVVLAACSGPNDDIDGGVTEDGSVSDGSTSDDGSTMGDGSTGSDGSVGTEVAFDDLCAVITGDICRALIECYGWEYADLDHCIADQECTGFGDLEAELAAGWIEYDPEAAARCHERFLADPCGFGSFFFVPTIHVILSICGDVVTGQQGVDEACAWPLDCVDGLYCARTDSCPGACQPFVGEGGWCTSDGDLTCDPSLVCRSGTCQQRFSAGDPCDTSSSSDCFNDGFWCDTDMGICREPVGEGETCETFGARCQTGLRCIGLPFDPGTCAPPSNDGGPCYDQLDCMDGLTCLGSMPGMLGSCSPRLGIGESCTSGSDCEIELRCLDGSCAARADLGEACSTGFGAEPCADGFVCDGSVCAYARFPGDACDDGMSVCASSLCRSGTCVTRARLGESCAGDEECASRTCGGGVCTDRVVCL